MHWNANAVEIQLPNQKLSTSYLIFHGRNVLLPVNYAITICGKKACGKEVYSKIKKKEKTHRTKNQQFYGPPMKLTVHEISCVQAYGHFWWEKAANTLRGLDYCLYLKDSLSSWEVMGNVKKCFLTGIDPLCLMVSHCFIQKSRRWVCERALSPSLPKWAVNK